jgi:DNA-binding response OmpR family regulator
MLESDKGIFRTDPNNTYTLLKESGRHISFVPLEREIQENKSRVARLSISLNDMLLLFITHPNKQISHAALFAMCHENDRFLPINLEDKEMIANSVRPLVSRLRASLESVDTSIADCVVTDHMAGWTYVPHKSVR